MKDMKKIIKVFAGLFVSIAVVFILARRILQTRKGSNDTNKKRGFIKSKISEKLDEVVSEIKEKVEPIKRKSKSSSKKESNSKTGLLSSRQKKILSIFKKDKTVEMEDIASKVKGVHVRTLRRDLNKLSDLKFIRKVGTTKGTSYRLK